jgi:hypothetical protein
MTHGIFVSKQGEDVKRTNKFLFDTTKKLMKVYKIGFFTYTFTGNPYDLILTINHDLKYKPMVWVRFIADYKLSTDYNRQSFNYWVDYGGLGSWFQSWYCYTDDTQLNLHWVQAVGEDLALPPDMIGKTFKFKYYIFTNRIE